MGRRGAILGAVVVCAGAAILLTGCRTEYRGYDSGIDGALARRIASYEDPLSRVLFSSRATGPADYLDTVDGVRWDGSTESASRLGLGNGGVVVYDVSSTARTAQLTVFIASGPRPDVPTDQGLAYGGPSSVYTCYGIEAEFRQDAETSVARLLLDACPPPLVEQLSDDATFASAEVFDG